MTCAHQTLTERCGKYAGRAGAKANPCGARSGAYALEGDGIAVLQEGALFTVSQLDGVLAALREFKHRAGLMWLGTRKRTGAKQVARAQSTTVNRMVRHELRYRPVGGLGKVAAADVLWQNHNLILRSHGDHHRIVEAVIERDGFRAEQLMREHVYYSGVILKGNFERLMESKSAADPG